MKSMRERILAQQQLMKFYQVNTLADLIEEQAKHIERLQGKELIYNKDFTCDTKGWTQVRQG